MSAGATQWTTDLELLLDTAPPLELLPREHDDTLIEPITAMEQGKARLAAVQAQAEAVFHDSQIREQKRLGVPRDELGRGIADQIGLARRITPKQASDELALRRILVTSMPRTTALLSAGKISEWAAHMVAANVVVLDDEDRATIDAEFENRLPKVTAGRANDITRARAMELDPEAAVARNQRAVSGRRVTLRPAVDGMSVLRAVLPVKDGVASFDALTCAFGFRNFADYARGLSEMWRVLAPGGRLVILEFPPPRPGLLGRLFRVYFQAVLPRIGALVSGNAGAYTYLPESVLAFPAPERLAGLMQATGFRTRFRRLTFGIAAIHVGDKG